MSVTELAGDFVPFALPIVKGQCDVGEDFEDSNQSPDAALAQLAIGKSHSVYHRVTYNELNAVLVQLASRGRQCHGVRECCNQTLEKSDGHQQ
ncbi:hypothetical protein B0G82_6799 [Paraburkholderia sp. BL17N1]|nr:hypothetical protein B0G82_6799 [Paraburkholderia sp. BL17N1]